MNRLQANLCLLTVVICWAFEVMLQKNVPSYVPVIAVMTFNNLIGCTILAVVFWKRIREHLNKKLCLSVLPLGVLNLLYNYLNFSAIRYLSPDVCTFVNTLTVVLMPIILFIFFKEKLQWQVWLGAVLVLAGIVGSLDLSFPKEQTIGLALMGAYAVAWAVYLIMLNKLAKDADAITLTTLILGTVGGMCLIGWVAPNPQAALHMEYSRAFLASAFADAYFICVFATVLNVYTQKYVSSLDAVALYSMQPAVVLIMAATLPPVLAQKIGLTLVNVGCCALITIGAIICQVDWDALKKHPSGEGA
jgi:drug/metabolite transporter (DMT)-like permease